jgi:hypothetical protein
VLAMVSVSVRPSALNFATSSGCSASETSSVCNGALVELALG